MAKKKSRMKQFKLSKKQNATLRRIMYPVVIAVVFACVGYIGAMYTHGRKQPDTLVWAADASVQIPKDLKNFLQNKNDCNDYLGEDTRRGTALWGVYEVSQEKFAKISYGCAFSLTNYVFAIKTEGQWKLIPPAEYFESGSLPLCSQLEKYNIDKSVEAFCVDAAGTARANAI